MTRRPSVTRLTAVTALFEDPATTQISLLPLHHAPRIAAVTQLEQMTRLAAVTRLARVTQLQSDQLTQLAAVTQLQLMNRLAAVTQLPPKTRLPGVTQLDRSKEHRTAIHSQCAHALLPLL